MTMKRRIKPNIKYPFLTARGDFAQNRGFENPCDTRKAKRVRFDNIERDGAPVLASSGGCEAIQSPKCGAPKTSEYAYFKNMKCGPVRVRSRAQREENDQKNSKHNFLVRETSSASHKLKPSTQDLNISVSGERAGPSNHNRFQSPCVSKYNESDKIISKELTNQIKMRSSLLPENVTPVGHSLFSSPLDKASEKEENQCRGNGIFLAKRQRLREWAHSSHSEVEKLHLKGFDLVPFLLSRLFPKGNENNDSSKGDIVNNCKPLTVSKSNDLENRHDVSHKRDGDNDNKDSSKRDTVNSCKPLTVVKSSDLENRLDMPRKRDWDNDNNDSSKRETVNSCKPLTVSKFNDLDNRLDMSCKRDCDNDNDNNDSSKGDTVNICKSLTVNKCKDLENRLDVSRKRDWENDLPKACSGRWSDIELAEQDIFVSGLPLNYRKENNILEEFMDPDKHSKSYEYRSSHAQLGFPLCLPFENYRSSGSSHLNALDEFGPIIECQREPYGLLLEWNNESRQDRLNSSTVNHGIQKNVFTRLDNSWNVDQMCNSSLSPAYYLESNMRPIYSSNHCLMPDFGPAFDDVKSAMEDPGQLPLALPYAPKCITLGEDKNGENVLFNSNIITSYRDEDWLNKKLWDEKPLSKFWWKYDYPSVCHPCQFPGNKNRLLSVSRLKEDPVEEPFTLYEGAFNHYLLSPLPRPSLNTFINRPLLLDHVNEYSLDPELYFDDLGYRKIF